MRLHWPTMVSPRFLWPERRALHASSVDTVHRSAFPFVIIGAAATVAGGLVSAASAPSPSYLASWAVAYLVLVVGVAQVVLGIGQSTLANAPLTARVLSIEAVIFNLGNLGVLLGTIVGQSLVVYVGAALIVAALLSFLWAVRGTNTHRVALNWGYRVLIVVLLVSIPVGLVIATIRAA